MKKLLLIITLLAFCAVFSQIVQKIEPAGPAPAAVLQKATDVSFNASLKIGETKQYTQKYI